MSEEPKFQTKGFVFVDADGAPVVERDEGGLAFVRVYDKMPNVPKSRRARVVVSTLQKGTKPHVKIGEE